MLRVTMETLVVSICLAVTAVAANGAGLRSYQRGQNHSESPSSSRHEAIYMKRTLFSRLAAVEERIKAFKGYQAQQAMIPEDGTLRIIGIDGEDSNSGLLQIIYFGVWGTVCNDAFNAEEAKVACRQMGKPFGNALAGTAPNFPFPISERNKLPIWLDLLGCDGTEAKLKDCNQVEFFDENCNHGEDIAVRCI